MFETHSFHRKYLDLEFSLSACQFLWESVEEPVAKVDVLLRAYILQLKSESIDIVHPLMVPLSYIHSKICSRYGHGFSCNSFPGGKLCSSLLAASSEAKTFLSLLRAIFETCLRRLTFLR